MIKIKISILIICLAISQLEIHAQELSRTTINSDSLQLINKHPNKSPFKTSLKAPAILVGAGLFALSDNEILSSEEIAEERNEKIPNFKTSIDDYLQFAPIAAVYGLNMAGIKGKNNFGNRTAILLKSELIMMAITFPTKQLTHTLRPDGSNYHSFPSGHTAQAFAAATFMHKEYGHLSPWYSIGAYASASMVGVFRVLNNKHYVSDVLVGAGVGILATNLAYLTHKYKWSPSGKKKNLVLLPSYNKGSIGFNMSLKLK